MTDDYQSYSDPEDKIDYQVIKSYGSGRNKPKRSIGLYAFISIVVAVFLCLALFSQSLKIRNLEKKNQALEARINQVETTVKNLETQLLR